jgi:enoyl-CoA hydratase/carnithine racemase
MPPEQVRASAIALAAKLADKAPQAFAGIKAGIIAASGGVLSATERIKFVDRFAASWFNPESIVKRRALAATLGKSI